MKDVRISVRLSEEMHEKLKILVIKKNTNMNRLLVDYITKLVEEDERGNEKND